MDKETWIELVIFGTIFSLVVSLALALPFMLLWNALLPGLFGFPIIGFWEALGFMVMISLFTTKRNVAIK